MPTPRALTATVFLDEVNEFNGPLVFIPGAHRDGTADAAATTTGWESTLTANLKYKIDTQTIKGWVDNHGMVAPKGPAGSVLWFDSNIPHGSVPNISPFDRRLVLIAYNSVENVVVDVASPRPVWLTNRDATPLTALTRGTGEINF